MLRARQEVIEAHAVARHEQIRRHQLEEDLRRMFLKNMIAMNMEALSLFNFPQEYSASKGEGLSEGGVSKGVGQQVRKDLQALVTGAGEMPRQNLPPAPTAGNNENKKNSNV